MSDYFERIQQRREEERRYEMDAMYEVWRAGGNTDRIDYERVDRHYENGDNYETAARDELRRQRPAPQEEQQVDHEDERDHP